MTTRRELEEMLGIELPKAVAQSEHIVDWAVSGDTLRTQAAEELFELWETTFSDVYER